MNKDLWIDTRLSQEEMDFLHKAIYDGEIRNDKNAPDHFLTGNVSRYMLIDKDK